MITWSYLLTLLHLSSPAPDPYWVKINVHGNFPDGMHFSGTHTPLSNDFEIQIIGFPRSYQCEYYVVNIDDKRFIFDNQNDLKSMLSFVQNDLQKNRFFAASITNNIGFPVRHIDSAESLNDISKAVDLLISISRLNQVRPQKKLSS